MAREPGPSNAVPITSTQYYDFRRAHLDFYPTVARADTLSTCIEVLSKSLHGKGASEGVGFAYSIAETDSDGYDLIDVRCSVMGVFLNKAKEAGASKGYSSIL